MTILADCACGNCRHCRQQLFPPIELEVTEQQREVARRAIDALEKIAASGPKAAPSKRRPVPSVIRPPAMAEPIIPTPCLRCGEMRPVVGYGRGSRVAGTNGLCELCFDTDWYTERIRANKSGEKKIGKQVLRMTRKRLQRVSRNGRPFHPDAPHGTTTSYSTYGCRCPQCIATKAAYARIWRSGKKS